MATLVLTAAGSLLGPAGGAVGALIGQAIDGRIFKPKGRQGPRLQDLKVQISSYGAPIPKLFGTMRVAGTVIWATDLVESRTRQGGGKGRPSTTTYSYSASFAVLLSARAIRSVGRIWADGNLLRGAAGDWKSETGFRLHPGDEDQAADPFIASAEGGDGTPAYRGCAYAVFENMALGPFGNRIPSLTLEVEADAGPVDVGTMLAIASDGVVEGAGGAALQGCAVLGESVAALIESLGAALPIGLRDDGAALRLVNPAASPILLDAREIGADQSETLPAHGQVPGTLTMSHYDLARDFQIGVQQARRPGGHRTERIELPAALDAGAARRIAEDALARIARESGRRSLRCGWVRIPVAPGALVRLPDDPGTWRVAARTIDREGVRLDLVRVRAGSSETLPAEPGRSMPAADNVHGPTVVHLLDLPNLAETAVAQPRLWVAAAGPSPGWRRAQLLVSLDSGGSWDAIGASAPPAIIGTATTILPGRSTEMFDHAHMVEVALLHGEMMLEDASDDRLLAGANLALLGNELIQFGQALPLGGNVWRLSRLTRGRRGTGWAAGGHVAGERFVVIEDVALVAYDPPLSAVGNPVRLLASGIGDPIPVEAGSEAIGEALRPVSPVHFTAARRTDGGFDLRWVRSSRSGWAWLDETDAPIGEERERYRLVLNPIGGMARSYDLTEQGFHYAAADVAADSAVGGQAQISVIQIGDAALSRPAHLTITFQEES